MQLPYTGNIHMQHNGDLLIISIQSKSKLDGLTDSTGEQLSDPFLYLHLEINKSTGELEKHYTGPWNL